MFFGVLFNLFMGSDLLIFPPSCFLLHTNISSKNDYYYVRWVFMRMGTVKVIGYFDSLNGNYMYTPYR